MGLKAASAYISQKLEVAEWGDGVVDRLADYLVLTQPGLRGFTRRHLFRMRQFYEAYRHDEKVSALLLRQAANNAKEQFVSSPDLTSILIDALIGSHSAQNNLSLQALNSEQIQREVINLLLGPARLYESLRGRGAEGGMGRAD